MNIENRADVRKRIKESFFGSEERLRLLTDSLKEGIVVIDRDGDVAFWNQGAERILGYTEQEVLGKGAVGFLSDKEHRSEYAKLWHSYLETGVSLVDQDATEFLAQGRNGKAVPIEITTSRMEVDDETYVVAVLRDLSTSKQAEQALQESETRYRVIERNLTDVIWMTDLNFILTYVSPSIFYQTGFRPEEVLSESLGKLITPESLQGAFEVLAKELSRADETHVDPPIPVGMLVEQYRKDGSTFWSEVRAGFLRRPDGTPYGGLGVSRDITERIQLGEAERENAAAVAAAEVSARYAEELKDIITIAAHELRLPATLFKGYSRILLDYRNKMGEEAVGKALSEIDAASMRLNQLVASLLETSLIEQKKMSLDLSPLSPSALVDRAIEGIDPWGSTGRLIFRDHEEGPEISLDAEKITRVLMILMDNALKYSPDQSPVDIWFEQGEEETLFHVLDRGPGIPADDIEKVFNRFYQVEDASYHSHPGLGLGLYIAKSIVELHDGWISVEPGEEGGSLFSFGLPRIVSRG
jgi:PAS domain S-box-containing protein